MENENQKRKKLLGQRYEIGPLLGSGSYATVRKCLEIDSRKELAVKCLTKELNGIDMNAIIDNEVRAIKASCNHPRICHLHEVMVSASKVYFIIDLASSSVLDKAETEQYLSENRARYIFIQLVETIAYLHSIGIAHRDIKPSNLMLDQRGELMLIDFGLAFVGNNLSLYDPDFSVFHRRSAVGSPHYAAPEVIDMPKNGYDPFKSDFWSIGVSLFVMLYGELPFKGAIRKELFTSICEGQIIFPKSADVSEQAKEVISHLVHINPNTRWGLNELRNCAWYQRGFVEATSSFKGWLVGSVVPQMRPEVPVDAINIIQSPVDDNQKKPYTALSFLKEMGCFDIHGPPREDLWDTSFTTRSLQRQLQLSSQLNDMEDSFINSSQCSSKCMSCEIDLTCPTSSYRSSTNRHNMIYFSSLSSSQTFDTIFDTILDFKTSGVIKFSFAIEVNSNHLKVASAETLNSIDVICDVDFVISPICTKLCKVDILRTKGDDLTFQNICSLISRELRSRLNSTKR